MAESSNYRKASEITPIDSHTYRGLMPEVWTQHGISQGGFAVGHTMMAVHKHFETTHASLNQPDSFSVHAQMLRPTPRGELTFRMVDVKLGRAVSTVQVTVTSQKGDVTIVAYVIQGNLKTMTGWTADTKYLDTLPTLPPKSDTETMVANKDPNWWHNKDDFWANRSGVLSHMKYYVPRKGMASPGTGDRWVRPREDVGGWTDGLVGFLADLPFVSALSALRDDMWLATLSFSIDFKKSFPEEGAEWALCRTSTAAMKNGKVDYNTIIIDEEGDVVALCTQVMMLVDGSKRAGSAKKSSKM